jgi:PhzF family phenazine biosynthesis protein
MPVTVYRYDAFTVYPDRGNPAGIVLDAQGLSDAQMQSIAAQVGYNETAFLLPAQQADWHFRFFSPAQEVDLCGHATIAGFCALYDNQRLTKSDLLLQTRVGNLPISVEILQDRAHIWMTQSAPRFVPFEGDHAALAASIGLQPDDLVGDLPIVYGSTGVWTLIVPVKGLDAMRRMSPHNASFPAVLEQMPRASIHPICFEVVDAAADMHARHFSSPYSGTVEDAVTGTASGVMGAYYNRYVARKELLLVEQGLEIERDGRVLVEVNADTVRIRGTAVQSQSSILALSSS